MQTLQLLRSRLLEQSLLLCRTEEIDLQLQSLRRIIFTAQSMIGQLSARGNEGDILDIAQNFKASVIDSSNERHAPFVGIDHLPVETLQQIFREYRDEKSTTHLSCLMGVNRHWRDIILNDPRLWSRIHVVPTGFLSNIEWYHTHIKRCLLRSRGVLLDITIDFSRVGWIPEQLQHTLGASIPFGYILDSPGYPDWGFENAGENIKEIYYTQLIDILRLLVGLSAISTFFFSEYNDDGIYGEPAGAAFTTTDVLSGCQSFHLAIPSFFHIEVVEDTCRLLALWKDSLRELSFEVEEYEADAAVQWPRDRDYDSRFEVLSKLSFNFPVNLTTISCNPETLRDLTIHVDGDSFWMLRRFTSLERLTLYLTYDLREIYVNLPSLSLPRLVYLTVDATLLSNFKLDLDVPSLHRLCILFPLDFHAPDLELLFSVKNLDLAVYQWLEKPSNGSNVSQEPLYSEEDLDCLSYFLDKCIKLENLRVWESAMDPKGTILMDHIVSAMRYMMTEGSEVSRRIVFVRPNPHPKDLDDGVEVHSYEVNATGMIFQPR